MLKDARAKVLLPALDQIIEAITALSHRFAEQPMLSRTHGQPDSPTTLGKEMAVFAQRLRRQRKQFADVENLGKMNVAVRNWNAHYAAYQDVAWPREKQAFIAAIAIAQGPGTKPIPARTRSEGRRIGNDRVIK